VLNNIGTLRLDNEEFNQAQECFVEAKRISEEIDDHSLLATALYNPANIQLNHCDKRETALEMFAKVLGIYKASSNQLGQLTTQLGMTGAYIRLERLDEAAYLLQQLGQEILNKKYENYYARLHCLRICLYKAKGELEKACAEYDVVCQEME